MCKHILFNLISLIMKVRYISTAILFSCIFFVSALSASAQSEKPEVKQMTGTQYAGILVSPGLDLAGGVDKKVKPAEVKIIKPAEVREIYLRQIFGRYAIIDSGTV